MAEQIHHTHIEITTSSVLKLVLIPLGLFVLYLLKDVVIVLLFAIIIASAVSPFVTWLEKKGLPRLLGVVALYLVVFGLVALVSSLVIPSVSEELSQLTSILPKLIERLSSSLDSVQQGSPKYLSFLSELQNLLDFVTGYLQQVSQSAVNLIIDIFGGVFSFFAIIVISFYLSLMRNGIESFLGSVVPREYRSYAISLWHRAEFKVGRWLQGQMLLGLVMGLLIYVGLSLLKVKFALMLGLLAATLEIVPVAGPVLAAIPAIFFGFVQAPTLGLWVLIYFTIAQQVENHVLVPIILGKTTGLNPVTVIVALLIGGKLAGLPGAILAVPVATVLVEMLNDLVEQEQERSEA